MQRLPTLRPAILLLHLLTTFQELESAASAAPAQTSCTNLREGATYASTASEFPLDGRALLQKMVEKPASQTVATGSKAASIEPQESRQLPEGHLHSLLQGLASRIAGSSHSQTRVRDVSHTLLILLAVASCFFGCAGLYAGSLMRSSRAAGERFMTRPLQTAQPPPPPHHHHPPHQAPQTPGRLRTVSQKQPQPDSTKLCLCPSLVVPAGIKSVLLLDFLEAKTGACSGTPMITNQRGGQVLGSYIERPSPGVVPKHPVVVLKKVNEQDVAKCFLKPGKNGLVFEICNSEGKPSAVLSIDEGIHQQQWTLRVGSSTAIILHITGQISDSLNAIVRDANGEVKAEAEPLAGVPLRATVRVYSGVDTGLVLCSLLGMGELVSSGQLKP
eukprot:TRINITY_DN8853_c5_g1_i1.p1 TRINITY_DN8853_c5_g1~~TRINITY_DN8853_c5_g1_i1.p1  ORF type:complete len:387 (-),score=54.58 TRINITY_DN8853_c5_g1_i1:5-1165(-)